MCALLSLICFVFGMELEMDCTYIYAVNAVGLSAFSRICAIFAKAAKLKALSSSNGNTQRMREREKVKLL